MQKEMYTRLDESIVSVNPNTFPTILGYNELSSIMKNIKPNDEIKPEDKPRFTPGPFVGKTVETRGGVFTKVSVCVHICEIARRAYQVMLKDNKQQSIVVSGASGSGKSVNTGKLMEYLGVSAVYLLSPTYSCVFPQ